MKTLFETLLEGLHTKKGKITEQLFRNAAEKAHERDKARKRGVNLSPRFLDQLESMLDQLNTQYAAYMPNRWGENQPLYMEIPRNMMLDPSVKGYIMLRFTRKNKPYPTIIWQTVYGKDENDGKQMRPEPTAKDLSKEIGWFKNKKPKKVSMVGPQRYR